MFHLATAHKAARNGDTLGWSNTARTCDASTLGELLQDSRARTLALLQAYADALGPTLAVPYSTQINPPRWEAGHIAWFQAYWIARNQQRALGVDCNPTHARPLCHLPQADALYNSSEVPHAARWSRPLPDLDATRSYMTSVLDNTLALLARLPCTDSGNSQDDQALYFYRLVLFHEDMHAEAAVYTAQALGIPLPESLRPQAFAVDRGMTQPLAFAARSWQLGYSGAGFAFDNELGAHLVAVPAFEIDAQPVNWRQFLAFVEAGGYTDARWWTPQGWQWRTEGQHAAPRYLRLAAPNEEGSPSPKSMPDTQHAHWQTQRFGTWQALDLDSPAVHLTHFEAEAWCRWAGRRLPTEAEWEVAALNLPLTLPLGAGAFLWGDVWEWTASPFTAYADFTAHPYRDYSAPWFDSRPVLRGACGATAPRMAHPRYRNYFTPERNDIFAGFRSCKTT